MKELLLFVMQGCPYCRQALAWQKELLAAHPEYAALPLRVVNETEEAELAARYPYYYVPCYFWGEEKLAEGVLSPQQIEAVFQRAWQEAQG